MATVTERLQQVIQERNPPEVEVTVEAEPGRGAAVAQLLTELGLEYDEVNVRRKTVFAVAIPREDFAQVSMADSIAVLDHSPTFTPLGVSPGPGGGTGGGGLIGESRPAENIRRISMRDVVERMNAPAAWEELGHRGEGAKIGMVDTGIDSSHPALEGSVEGTEKSISGELHGTWVASALVADRFEARGGEIMGIAPDADLYAHGALAGGGASTTEIAEGINYCIEQDVDVVNLSFGGEHSQVLENLLGELLDNGTAVVSSIGNSGPGPGSGTCPAHHGEALAVGSVDIAGSTASFSSRGPGWAGEVKPDVVAYGGGALSESGVQVITETVLGAAPNRSTEYLVGTSMASPQVAGIAALRAAARKEE